MVRPLIAILGLLLLQACSAVKLGYPQLPTLSFWWLDNALSLNEPQAERARLALRQLHQWHRSQELATYADVLQRGRALSQGAVQASQVCLAWSEVQAKIDHGMRMAIAQAAPVVQLLGARQLSHLARYLEQKNEEWEQQWLQGSTAQRLEKRVDNALARYRSFYGDLNAAQIAMVTTQVSQSTWSPQWGRQERLRREQDLLSTLQRLSQSDMPLPQAQAELWRVWQHWFLPPDEAGRALVQKMTQQACDNLAQLHNTTTPEQRQNAVRKWRGYERDLVDLAKP